MTVPEPICDATIEDGRGRLRHCQLRDGHYPGARHRSSLNDGHDVMDWTDDAAFSKPASSTTPVPTVQVAKYLVCALPDTIGDRYLFEVAVEWRGRGLWAVTRHQQCLGADGEWDYEMRPSEREDDWLAEHRFDEQTAIKLAKEAALKVRVNGWTVERVLAREEADRG